MTAFYHHGVPTCHQGESTVILVTVILITVMCTS